MAWSELRRSGTSSDEGLQETFYTKWESPLNIKCTVKLELASLLIRDDCFWECMYFITVPCKGDVFTPVCQSFCSQRGRAWWGGMCGRWCAWQGGMCGRGHAWQGGMCGRGCVWQGEGCMAGGAWQGACMPHMPPPRHYEIRSVNVRAVRILLECILVFMKCIKLIRKYRLTIVTIVY